MQPAISIVNLTELNEETRLDAEYYNPQALSYLEKLKSKSKKQLSDKAKFIVGPFGSTVTVDKYIDESDYSYIRNLDVSSFQINSPEAKIPKELFDKLEQFHLKENDLLVTVVGTLGKVAIVQAKDTRSIFSCKSTGIRCKEGLDPYYLSAYLNSNVGQTLLLRCKRGAIQEGLNLFDLKTVAISTPSNDLQLKVRDLVTEAFSLKSKSASLLATTNQSLISHIGFAEFIPSKVNYSSRISKDVVSASRLDGEYWLPMYDEILNIINSYQNGVSQIGNTFKQIKSNFKPEKDSKYKYVEIGGVNITQPDFSYTELVGEELPTNAKIKLKNKTLVTSKVRPIRGATAILNDENEYIVSGAFVALQEKEMNLETLYAYLKLEPIKELLLRYNTGTSYPTITDNDVLNLPIPNISADVQSDIQYRVISATEHLKKSKMLLEVAKRAVEVFIEQDENTAMKYINNNTSIRI